MNVSDVLLNYRAKNNLTQKQLSEKLNVTETWVNKLESGNFKTSKLMIEKIKILVKEV